MSQPYQTMSEKNEFEIRNLQKRMHIMETVHLENMKALQNHLEIVQSANHKLRLQLAEIMAPKTEEVVLEQSTPLTWPEDFHFHQIV